MFLKPDDISIGVTVFRRLEYLEASLASAVNQTVPVKVNLYDDGCQDQKGLQDILARFGNRVEYHRNPKTLGLFQNMNQCIWKSPTPWVSVLHDDDMLDETFVEQLLAVAPEVEPCALFCGGTTYIDPSGKPFFIKNPSAGQRWHRVSAEDFAIENQFSFPGQLIHVATARRVGGFPEKSLYTGDWELWFKLTLEQGTVQLGSNLSYYRSHLGASRGTTAASKSGRKSACCAAQVKRNLARLHSDGPRPKFDRAKWLLNYGPLYRDLLVYSWTMPSWLLSYNRRLLLKIEPASRMSRRLHWISKIFGNVGIRLAGLARTFGEWLGITMPQTF
jgi:glycosyltransferase involved in cell wall biosynthesis